VLADGQDHQSACHMAIPGSGHSQAPKKEASAA
jgi:hypothetical protein